ncbi:MAG TPA: type II toxin-antitoxin system RelE/ParE family toxin [Candidatus Baltobacteraceae bacterium]
MAHKLRYSAKAREDLRAIRIRQLQGGSLDAAVAFERRLRSVMQKSTMTFKDSGRARHEFGPGVRCYPVAPYLVFYQVHPGEIYVLRILHGHRDIHPPLMSLLMAG